MVRSVRNVGFVVAAVAAAAWCSDRAPAAAAASCESLASLSLPNTTIASAAAGRGRRLHVARAGRGGEGAASAFKDLPAFCRVTGSVARAGDTDVKIEVWMPAEEWTGDFQPAASGFAGGTIGYAGMAPDPQDAARPPPTRIGDTTAAVRGSCPT